MIWKLLYIDLKKLDEKHRWENRSQTATVISSFASHEYRSDCHRRMQNIIYSWDIASAGFLAIPQIDILGVLLESLLDNGVLFY